MISLLASERRKLALAELLAISFMGFIALLARTTGVSLFLFPELAALAHDVLARPRGKWASQPLRLIATPVLTATAGLFVTRHLPYGALSLLLIVIVSLAVIRLLRSAIGPAISAGLLPLVVGERHWLYPAAIAGGLVSLSVILWLWKRWVPHAAEAENSAEEWLIDDTLETPAHDRFWLLHLLGLVAVLGVAGQLTGLRFLLFPPLVVMAYELFGHPELPGWIERPAFFPLVCFLTALTGLLDLHALGNTMLSVVLTVAASIVLLRLFRMHMPPALAVGLLPFVSPSPTFWYPISVAIGTMVLSVWFALRCRGNGPSRPALLRAIGARPASSLRIRAL